MASKTTAVPTAVYVPGADPATVEANRVYQDALRKLNESLDLRKNRTFDPMLLAAAQGFLSPTKSGNFFESLGSVAGSLGQAQEKRIAEQQEEARQRLDVARAGLEVERLRQRERLLGGGLGMRGPSPATESGAPAAGGLPGATPVPTGGGLPDNPPGLNLIGGVRVAPPASNMLSSQQYIGLAGLDTNEPVHKILKEAADLELKKFVVKEGGFLNLETGEFFPFPKSEQVQREINGQIYNIDSRSAMFLDLYRATNDPRFYDLANRLIGGPNLRGPPPNPAVGPGTSAAPGPAPVPALGPAAGPAAGPAPVSAPGPAVIPGVGPGAVGVGAVVAPLRSEEQIATQRSEAQSRAKALGEEGAKREAAVTASDRSARMIYGITSRVGNYLRDSQNYFGIFQRPSVMSAIGNLVSQGLQTPSGSINLPGLQQAVTQVLPGVGQRDLDNIQRAAADLAELELLFARQYLSGQGQVTEGERRIVARIPGGVSNSPEVLRTRLNILRERSQFDIDTGSAWDAWRKDNPGKSILEFESSPAYKDLQKRFEQRLAKIENRLPAIPTSQRPTPPGAPKPSPGLEAAREMARRALQQ